MTLSVPARQPPLQSAPVHSVAEAPWPPDAPLSCLLPDLAHCSLTQGGRGRGKRRGKKRTGQSPPQAFLPPQTPALSSSDTGVQGGKPTSESPKTPAVGMYKPDAASPAPPKRCTGPLTVTPSQSVRTSQSDPRQPLHLARLFYPETKRGNQGGS